MIVAVMMVMVRIIMPAVMIRLCSAVGVVVMILVMMRMPST